MVLCETPSKRPGGGSDSDGDGGLATQAKAVETGENTEIRPVLLEHE